LIEDAALLRNAAAVDDSIHRRSSLLHALKNDAGVQSGSLDGSEELILSHVHQVPAQGDAAEIGIDQNGPVTVVPCHA
jgi:hypothetical protein